MKRKSLQNEVNDLILNSDLFYKNKFKLERNSDNLIAINKSFKIETMSLVDGLKIYLSENDNLNKMVSLKISDNSFDYIFADLPKFYKNFSQKTRIMYDKDLDKEIQFLYNEEIGNSDSFGKVELGKDGNDGKIVIKTSDYGYNDNRVFSAYLLKDVKKGFRKSKIIQSKIDCGLNFIDLMFPGMEELLEDNYSVLIADEKDGYDFYKCFGNTVVNDIYRFSEDQKAKKRRRLGD